MSLEQPVLFLGVAGFDPEQSKQLSLLLSHLPKGWPSWHSGAFSEADAWLVSGQKSRLLNADTLRILAGLPTERTLQLNLTEVDRPIAFSLPLASDDLDPMYTFDPASGASLRQLLQQFEVRLRPLCCQFVLGGQLIARESQLQPGIYHVNHKGRLLAVMDFIDWRIGISPSADPADFELARWDRRPIESRDMPAHFLPSSLAQLRWVYVQRTRRDVLPARYRTHPVYFRRAPVVPLRWLADSQLLLLRELSAEPGDFKALLRRTGLPQSRLVRDLACLYFAGSVTTTPDKAGTAGFAGTEAVAGSAQDIADGPSTDPESAYFRQPQPKVPADLTVPVQLGFK